MKKVVVAVAIIVVVAVVIFVGLSRTKEIKVGLLVDLSGKNSALGISARNGLNMAINEINESEPGYVVKLITKDHENNPVICRERAEELVAEEIDVIISPVMSGMVQHILDGVESNTLVIGPTVSSVEFSGIDDNFVRISSPSSLQGEYMANEMIKNGQKNAVMILDEKNGSYTFGVAQGVKDILEKDSSINLKVFTFSDSNEVPSLVKRITEIEPDAILFSCNGIDCGNITQLYALEKPVPQLYGSSWVKVSDAAKYGGKRLEGMIFADSFKSIHLKKEQQDFLNRYKKLFNMDGNTPAVYFYEAMQLYSIAYGKAKTTETEAIKEALFSIDDYQGIYEKFSIDKYGDAVKKLQLYKLIEGEYVAY